jgi:hypothetical protein
VNPLILFAAILVATPDPQTDPSAPQTNTERVGARIVKEPIPSCQPGHESALANGTVAIRPGETICLSLQVKGDVIALVQVVTPPDPKDVLVLRLWQDPQTNETFLTINNPLATFIQYEAALLRPGSSQAEATSSCDVLSHRIGLEQWPYPISELILKNFKSLPESKSVGCR